MSGKDDNDVQEDVNHTDEGEAQPKSPEPSHLKTGRYVALMETSEKECESWYYFIRLGGNITALKHLHAQLEQVEWYIQDDLSTFDLDLDHTVSAMTAKQMTKLELNSHSFHRKFDGKLEEIDLGFRKKDSDERKMEKVFDLLGYGQVEDYINDEDLDPEDLTDDSSDSGSESESSSESDHGSESDSCSGPESSDDEKEKGPGSSKKKTGKRVGRRVGGGIPPALLKSERPRWTRSKGFRKHA
jgi:hypothetical protein